MLAKLKGRKYLLWALALLTACGIAIAVSDLSGQANKSCADAGLSGADMEMATLDAIKKPAKPKSTINWSKWNSLEKKVNAADAQYTKIVAKAQSEISANGKVSDATKNAGFAAAKKFQNASENFAKFLTANNCITRAKVARETGNARIKNADMTFNEIDSDKISAYNDQMEVLADARKAYLEEAKTDVSAEDRASIKDTLLPRLNNMTSQVSTLATNVSSLLSQVKDQVLGGGVGGLVSCTRDVAASDNPAAKLLSPITSLLDLIKSLGSNISGMIDDISSL